MKNSQLRFFIPIKDSDDKLHELYIAQVPIIFIIRIIHGTCVQNNATVYESCIDFDELSLMARACS